MPAVSVVGIKTVEDAKRVIRQIKAQPGYKAPAACAVGVAHVDDQGNLRDTWFPTVNALGEHPGVADLLVNETDWDGKTGYVKITGGQLINVRRALAPYLADGGDHPNIRALDMLIYMVPNLSKGLRRKLVVAFIDDYQTPPASVPDTYLRLHLLSHCKVRPHGINLDDILGDQRLPLNVWTSRGPVPPEKYLEFKGRMMADGRGLSSFGKDRFPRMLDYVEPEGVRIANADQVRLGAHLARGTVVMHAGFVNFNAGTLGKSMVEGRISAGVVVGEGSDVGGGASTMGTLSGGGKQIISIGSGSLVGANAGIGISLGDRCVVEAGAYITAGSRVLDIRDPSHPITVRASELSGVNDLLFRRNSLTGALEVLSSKGVNWRGLNEVLHQND